MSIDINDLGLPFCGDVITFSAESPKANVSSKFQELAFEVHDPVPPYQPASEEVLNFVNDTIKSPQTKLELQKAVRDLGDSAYSIEVCFNNVANGLHEAQRCGTEAQKQSVKKFSDQWKMHHKEYIRLLWESRRVAGHARATANDFAGDFLNLMAATNVTLPEKKEEIQAYRKQLQDDVKNSSNLSQGFYNLRNDVDRFQGDIVPFLQSGHQLEARVENLRMNLETIKQEISGFAFLDATAVVGLGYVAAGGFAVGILCPLLWIGAAVAMYHAVGKGIEIVQTIQNRNAKTAELARLQEELEEQRQAMEGMLKIQTILDPLKSDMELIKEKLVVFGKIWQLIHADLNEIERSLELATSSAGAKMFQSRLRTVSTIYRALAEALYQYETNVHIQNVAKLRN
ncbi:hypothetical protein BKA82DRAFT_1007008 [Pisolithus tinctorius]|uniref:Uncharacterized protein n=1 Tax=Pisolithus tinctorius Marx 270 TaxID=870435 RepID=A0A0C3IGE8_PISTI|nr:hypothetical protein BKA82DRAFT_1007008 [Pisolithus tinctorius]KIN96117.1 hypothetical protein M404DRAFT_1007008 [Pisolithus tinctorius Marx 270]